MTRTVHKQGMGPGDAAGAGNVFSGPGIANSRGIQHGIHGSQGRRDMGEIIVHSHIMAFLFGQGYEAIVNRQRPLAVFDPLLIHLVNQALLIAAQRWIGQRHFGSRMTRLRRQDGSPWIGLRIGIRVGVRIWIWIWIRIRCGSRTRIGPAWLAPARGLNIGHDWCPPSPGVGLG